MSTTDEKLVHHCFSFASGWSGNHLGITIVVKRAAVLVGAVLVATVCSHFVTQRYRELNDCTNSSCGELSHSVELATFARVAAGFFRSNSSTAFPGIGLEYK